MRGAVGLVGALAACGGDGGDGTGGPGSGDDDDATVPTGDTGSSPPPAETADTGETPPTEPTIDVSCLPQPENALRFDCDVTVYPAAEVEIAFAKADGTGLERVHASGRVGTRQTVSLYVMAPDTTYEWEARVVGGDGTLVATGIATTGAVPPIAKTRIFAQGTSTARFFGMVAPCQGGTAVVLDAESSEVVWYDRMAWNNGGVLEAVSFSDEGTVLGIGTGGIVERTWAGEKTLDLAPGADLPLGAHHDVFRRGNLLYALFSEQWTTPLGADVRSDGFYVIDDPTGAIRWEWHLKDFVTPSVPPGGLTVDWSHANAVWSDTDQDVIISLRHLSAAIRVEGDPADPDFGQPVWSLTGQATSDVTSDFALAGDVAPADFYHQHNVHLLPDGTLTMFDNRPAPERSRVLDVALDPAAGTATLLREYVLPGDPAVSHCDFQGGAWRTSAGNPVATCAPQRTAYEFDATTGDLVWTATVACDGSGSSYVPRFVPLDL